MSATPRLSIVIPTYNRADLLDLCFEVNIPLARAHKVEIFIFDNASTDATTEVVKRRMAEYPLIQYHRSGSNLGADGNFERALKYPQTEYIWLLGDTYQIPPEGIGYVLELISREERKLDALILNLSGRVPDIPQQEYSDHNKLLSDLGWHMTCMSCLVYSSKLISEANFKRYRNTNFLQTGILLEYVADGNFIIHWAAAISIQGISLKGIAKESWQDKTIEIWVKKWTNFIFSLPPVYELDIKLKCIKDHGIKTGILSLNAIKNLRRSNFFNHAIYKEYSHLFPLAIDCSKMAIFSVLLLPQSWLRLIKKIKTSRKAPR